MKYITAVSALNIPCNGVPCDWHQVEMLKNKFYQILDKWRKFLERFEWIG